MVRPKPKENGLKTNRDISKDGKCFHYESLVIGKETALFFLKESRKLKAVRGSVSSIYVIDDDTKYRKT